jgi:hypothetical protein
MNDCTLSHLVVQEERVAAEEAAKKQAEEYAADEAARQQRKKVKHQSPAGATGQYIVSLEKLSLLRIDALQACRELTFLVHCQTGQMGKVSAEVE